MSNGGLNPLSAWLRQDVNNSELTKGSMGAWFKYMNPATQPENGTIGVGGQVQIEIKETDVVMVVEESEKVREKIRMQATEVGPILEALLRDAHGEIRWGLNE